VKTILVSPTVIVARKSTPELDIFGEIIKASINAEKYQLVKMNADQKARGKILEILPAMQSPTMCDLANGSFSIETIVRKKSLVSLLMDLRKIGATDILVQDVNIVLA
jgi:ATP phosphoribosyltransferase